MGQTPEGKAHKGADLLEEVVRLGLGAHLATMGCGQALHGRRTTPLPLPFV